MELAIGGFAVALVAMLGGTTGFGYGLVAASVLVMTLAVLLVKASGAAAPRRCSAQASPAASSVR